MTLRLAQINDIDKVLALHKKYQVDSINEEDKKDGFITTNFTKEQLTRLIVEEQGLFIALEENKIIAYVMAASWHYFSQWKMFEYMIENLQHLEYKGLALHVNNSYQYGPICIDKSVRGSGVLEEIFAFSLKIMSKKYPILITFINKIKGGSYLAPPLL